MGLIIQKSEVRSQKSDHDRHAGHSTNIFKKKFWVSLVLTIPVVLYSDLPEKLFGWTAPEFLGSQYLPLVFGSIVFFYGGWIFLTSAIRELRAKLPGMMTLIALAITTAYLWSIYAVLSNKETLFWELTTLITVMLLGHWMEMRAVQGAQSALKELSKLLPDTAEIIIQKSKIKNQNDNLKSKNETKIIPLSELKEGDIVFVRPGGKIPADGTVVEGKSDVNESLMTGESKPAAKSPGSEVIAGAINGDGALKIKVTKIGEHTFLAGVVRLVEEAQASKSRLQMLSDRAAFYLTVIAVAGGILTLLAWLLLKADPAFAVERLVAVLVIACPHALGLAIPLVASISTTMGARNGVLVKQRLALEAARNINVVLFDKTGTLTRGEYGVSTIVALPGVDEGEFLRLAASIDVHSEHFIARAIVKEAARRNLKLSGVKNFERLPGKGVKGQANGSTVVVGGEAILTDYRISVPEKMQSEFGEFAKQGQTIIYVLVNNQFVGAIALTDIIREESRQAIKDLKALGVKVAMLTGDSDEVASWVARELSIDEYYARVLPGEKAEIVKRIQNPKHEARNSKQIQNSNGQNTKQFRISDFGFRDSANRKFVAMVGDGINDAPALTQADLGIAIGAGTNVAIESAGIILVKNDPRDIVKIIRLSRATYSKMLQNLFWATGYNIVALPLAAGVLISYGIILNPAVSAIFMSLSTVIVAINALLLKNQKLG